MDRVPESTDRVMVISSDSHGGVPTKDYKPYLEAKYHRDIDDYDRWLAEAHLDRTAYFEKPIHMPPTFTASREKVAYTAHFTDSDARLKDLEKDGVVSEVIYPGAAPSTLPPWSDFLSAGSFRARTPAARVRQAIGERAYNRWLADFCQAAPKERRLGLVLLPTHDVHTAVKEVEWAAKAGLRGIVLPFFNYDVPEYTNRYWDPIWAACAANEFTVNFHGGYGSPEMGDFRYLWFLELMFWPKRTISQLIFSGVFDRYPTLKCTLTEARAGWIPDAMRQFDKFFDHANGPANINNVLVSESGGMPKRRPGEYWRSNWFAGCSITNLEEMQERHDIGINTMMYGIDYPHPEGSWGGVNWWVSLVFGDAQVTEGEARLILGENVARLYKLDLKALAPVVNRVGPRIEQVLSKIGTAEMESLFEKARASGRELTVASYRREHDLSR